MKENQRPSCTTPSRPELALRLREHRSLHGGLAVLGLAATTQLHRVCCQAKNPLNKHSSDHCITAIDRVMRVPSTATAPAHELCAHGAKTP